MKKDWKIQGNSIWCPRAEGEYPWKNKLGGVRLLEKWGSAHHAAREFAAELV